MRTIWSIVSVLAVANLLALAGFFVWLKTSGRLSTERIEQVRLAFRETLEAEQQRASIELAQRLEEESKQAEAARLASPPESAATVIDRNVEAEQVRMQHMLLLQQEQRTLRASLERMRTANEEERLQLAREKQEFAEYRARLADTEGAEQFKKALDTLQGQKPKDAKDVLQSLLAESKAEQVVSYLSAMDDRARSRIVAEFVKVDPAVAGDLLERLRTRGVAVPPGTEIAGR
ncbi:MAG: hypothetical protein KF745_02220 [Phycisphaeraceae bacterium]|nr:hypothetical protein [Phycisphaeraceae bacterium]